ncbi:MAG: chemotaxis-specific protein-glutamate methyltransferase CheB [Magnetococcales bacterium]|nr:chemotaxis-specific protein-glutamate methyltransferase CheB [Magnetococcales bacterium]
MIRVLIVDDSLTSRELLRGILESDPEIRVVGVAASGAEVIAMVERSPPHVVVMDINMPGMNGYEATQRILERHPLPIVICSAAWQSEEAVNSLRAIDAGAVTALPKPQGPGSPNYQKLASRFIRLVKAMAEVRVICRRAVVQTPSQVKTLPASDCHVDLSSVSLPFSSLSLEISELCARRRGGVDIVAIGASTGGPPVIKAILGGLDRSLSVPVIIVQHIADGFLMAMTQWLENELARPVRIASDREKLEGGVVYFAPDQFHLGVRQGVVVLDGHTPPKHGLRPSVSHLFRSLAAHYRERAVGILLTGMGRDGAEALKLMRDQGALTIAQDQESSLVFGMPGEAIKMGAAQLVLSPERIIATLNSLLARGG